MAESDSRCEHFMELDFGGVKEKWTDIKQEARRRTYCIMWIFKCSEICEESGGVKGPY